MYSTLKHAARLVQHYRADFDAEGRKRLLARNVLAGVPVTDPAMRELARIVLEEEETKWTNG
jgi:hypothetical protein